MVTTMHAVRAHRRGGPEQLRYETAPRPEPDPGEALVAVRAASVTAGELDWDATWTDSFDGSGRDRTPTIPSHEVSGVVADVGPGVVTPRVGEAVYALIPFVHDGAAAEFVTLPAGILAPKPRRIDHDAAASVPLAALTVWQALARHAGVTPGRHVLVHGAAGGVGSFAVQIAAALGAQVTATAAARDAGFVAGLGARRVVDYAGSRFEDEVADVDVVFDAVGGDTQDRSWSVLRPGGLLVSIVSPPDPATARAHGARGVFFVVEPDRAGLEAVSRLIDGGKLTPRVDRVVPLTETRAAYEALEHEHRRGKVVIHVADGT
ncbi:NADP-dependent oxidoreductase [Actinacidiphila glaucinigra]|uniref:NADPH:quinone reductase n=1 Tax=Actinacidiphila glaucinigra TaxID=235986 RepID=A0A239D5Q2_9ACTN|nr:NADP-dependent oxidoreductase [Actinacidiphila glaucinigra]SNS27338.1 NADPH:quinone reductase [Actinacidiphila glaucinigra]